MPPLRRCNIECRRAGSRRDLLR